MKFHLPIAVSCAAVVLGLGPSANAQDDVNHRVTYIEVAPSSSEQTADLLAAYAETSLRQHGNRLFLVLQRIARTHHFVVLETWDNAELQTAHAGSEYAVRFRDALEPLLLSPPDSRPHSDLFTAEAANTPPGSVFVVTHVDVLPPYTDTAVGLLGTLVSESRHEEGNARFDVWSLNDHPNHMTMVEAWDSQAARERHATAAHTRAFRSDLSPLNGALYDERLYLAL